MPYSRLPVALISIALMPGRMTACPETRWLANALQFADYDIVRLIRA
jgi:hypothetical protein